MVMWAIDRRCATGSKSQPSTCAARGEFGNQQNTDAGTCLRCGRSEAFCSTGYSPMLSFEVPDVQECVTRLIPLGAHMDGPIRHETFGKVAVLRSPDGQMVSLSDTSL